jgi:hypothetical protein
MIFVFSKISNNCLYYNKEPCVFPCQEGWHRSALSLFTKVPLAPDRDTANWKNHKKGCGTKQRAAAFSRFHTLL